MVGIGEDSQSGIVVALRTFAITAEAGLLVPVAAAAFLTETRQATLRSRGFMIVAELDEELTLVCKVHAKQYLGIGRHAHI